MGNVIRPLKLGIKNYPKNIDGFVRLDHFSVQVKGDWGGVPPVEQIIVLSKEKVTERKIEKIKKCLKEG